VTIDEIAEQLYAASVAWERLASPECAPPLVPYHDLTDGRDGKGQWRALALVVLPLVDRGEALRAAIAREVLHTLNQLEAS
jgi:hypothetical protein